MKRSQKKVEVTPPMPKGETEFEEKRIAKEFELVFARMSNSYWSSLKDSYEYSFRAGYTSGKAIRERETLPHQD